jgi:hypothetical protein
MKTILLSIITAFVLIFSQTNAQNVGINDDNSSPDPSAMLDIKSSNKGMLVPRIQLNNLSSASPVTNPASGLLVYANSSSAVEEGFYYWNGTKWEKISNGGTGSSQTLSITGHELSISGGNSVTLPDNVDDADASPTNELQDLSLSGNTLSLSGDATSVDLSKYTNTDNQTLSINGTTLSISNGNSVILPSGGSDADADPTNELQNLSQVLSRGNDAGSNRIVNLGNPVNNNDAVTKSFVMSLIDGMCNNTGYPYLEDFNSFTDWHPSTNNSSGCTWTVSNGFAQIASMATASGNWVYALYETDLALSIPPGTNFSLKAHVLVSDGDPANTLSGTGVALLDNNNDEVATLGHNDSQASSGYGGIHIHSENGYVFNSDPDGFSTTNPEYSGILEIRRIGSTWSAYVDGIFKGSLAGGSITRTATKIQIYNGRYSNYGYRNGKIDFIIISLL